MPPRSSATRLPLPQPSPRSRSRSRSLRLRVGRENALFQHLDALKRNRTTRQRSGEIFVEGVRPITRALEHGWRVTTLAYADTALRPLSTWARDVLAAAPAAQRVELTPPLMEKLSDKDEPSELVAVVGMPEDAPERIRFRPTEPPLVCVMDRPVSPGNLGAIVRSCDGLGADALIVTGHGADVYDPQTIRASQGSLFALPVVRLASHLDVARWLERVVARGAAPAMQVVGATGEAERAAEEVDLARGTVLVLGNETHGLSRGYRSLCDALVRIPMIGTADSLNVACAASILLYEASRQRRARR